eukprot:GHVU01128959.1.p4 GENE.GHVU01128959.1~~GHVU01128959.1.p4  ORF type:complete len:112 (-),score=20.68 GHVU01128959.1:192-527(-)
MCEGATAVAEMVIRLSDFDGGPLRSLVLPGGRISKRAAAGAGVVQRGQQQRRGDDVATSAVAASSSSFGHPTTRASPVLSKLDEAKLSATLACHSRGEDGRHSREESEIIG